MEDKENVQEEVIKEVRVSRDLSDHKGPIKAWAEHFHRYLKQRTEVAEDSDLFHPKIDRESQKIVLRNGIGQ